MFYITFRMQAGWFPGDDFHFINIDLFQVGGYSMDIITVQIFKFSICFGMDWHIKRYKTE